MDDLAEEIRRRISEAHGVSERLTRMQHRIRREHDRIENEIRGFSRENRPAGSHLPGMKPERA